MPIIKIKQIVTNNNRKYKRVILYTCDSCDTQFERAYKKALLEKNKDLTYCSKQCYYVSKKKGGKDYQKRLENGDLTKAAERMNTITKEKYGAHASQLDFVKKKVQETNKKRYGGTGYASKSLAKKSYGTTLERHGVEFALQSDKIKQKQKLTNQEKYGYDHYLQSPEVQKKAELTNMIRYGGKKPMCSYEVQNKHERTCLERYGVRNYSQTQEFTDMNIWDKYHVTGYIQFKEKQIYYRSSYEKTFLKWCVTHSHLINDVISNILFKYFRKTGKEHVYFADFLVEYKKNRKRVLYEIKPEAFVTTELNQVKFESARKQLHKHNIDKFIVLTEKKLAHMEKND